MTSETIQDIFDLAGKDGGTIDIRLQFKFPTYETAFSFYRQLMEHYPELRVTVDNNIVSILE